MGVDARMLFTMTSKPEPSRLRRIQYHLMERVGKEIFWCSTRENPQTGEWGNAEFPQMFLQVAGTYEQDGPDIQLENAVEVKLFCRYYGEGYERGPALELVAIMLTLLGLPDVIAVYYGGDSSGICAEPYTQEKVLALLAHYCAVGSEPYHGYFDRRQEREGEPPVCSYCEVPLLRNGFGGAYAAFYCQGCGESLKLKDDVYRQWAAGALDVKAQPRFNGVAQSEDKELF